MRYLHCLLTTARSALGCVLALSVWVDTSFSRSIKSDGHEYRVYVGQPDLASPADIRLAYDSANGDSYETFSRGNTVSADGRYVVFESIAPDLVSNDGNAYIDIFRYDRHTGQLQLVSLKSDGTGGANEDSRRPVISADGNRVAFESKANNLVANDPGALGGEESVNDQDIFVRHRSLGTTEAVTVRLDNEVPANKGAWAWQLSADGCVVAYTLQSEFLGLEFPGYDGSTHFEAFARVLPLGETVLLSRNLHGIRGNGESAVFGIAADGGVVGFDSIASDLVPHDYNGSWDSMVTTLDVRPADFRPSHIANGQGGTSASNPLLAQILKVPPAGFCQ